MHTFGTQFYFLPIFYWFAFQNSILQVELVVQSALYYKPVAHIFPDD